MLVPLGHFEFDNLLGRPLYLICLLGAIYGPPTILSAG